MLQAIVQDCLELIQQYNISRRNLHNLGHYSIDHVLHPDVCSLEDKQVVALGSAAQNIVVLEYMFVSLEVGWPNNLFPILRRIAPCIALW